MCICQSTTPRRTCGGFPLSALRVKLSGPRQSGLGVVLSQPATRSPAPGLPWPVIAGLRFPRLGKSACSRPRRSALLAFARGLLGCQGASGGLGVTPHRGVVYTLGCYPSRGITHFAIRLSYRAITVAYRQLRGEGLLFSEGYNLRRTRAGLYAQIFSVRSGYHPFASR